MSKREENLFLGTLVNNSVKIKEPNVNPYPDASWSGVGDLVYKLPKWVYQKPIWNDCDIVVCLGAIKLRSDGRWSWWRFKSKHFPGWLDGEGVSLTKTGAIFNVYEGLLNPPDLSGPPPMSEIHKYIKDGECLGVVVDTHTRVFPWTRHLVTSEPTWKKGSGRATSLEEALCQMVRGWA